MLDAFKLMLLAIDPKATKNAGTGDTAYTTWTPYQAIIEYADGTPEIVGWKVQIDRYTTDDSDGIARAICTALITSKISFEYLVDFDIETGYFHHIYDCVVI